MLIKRGKPRTDAQIASEHDENFVVTKTTDGQNYVGIDMNRRFSIGSWTCYPMVKAGYNSFASVKHEPGVAAQYRTSTRLTLIDRTDWASILCSDLNDETRNHVKEIFKTAMEDAGMDNSPENRRGLIRVLDEFMRELLDFNYDPMRQVAQELPDRTGFDVKIGVADPDGNEKIVMERG